MSGAPTPIVGERYGFPIPHTLGMKVQYLANFVTVRCTYLSAVGIGLEINAQKPFEGSNGGKLLEPATLVMEANAIPTMMTDGIGSNVPESIREAFDMATHHFNRLDYNDAAVRCRFTLEFALMERGISRDQLPVMADQAKSQTLVTELVKNFCVVVAGIGGDAAHPQTNPARYVDRNEALLAIDTTANVLRRLYPSTGSD